MAKIEFEISLIIKPKFFTLLLLSHFFIYFKRQEILGGKKIIKEDTNPLYSKVKNKRTLKS